MFPMITVSRSFGRILSVALAAALVIAALVGRADAAQAYYFQELGTLGGSSSYAWRLNNAGQVIGYAQTAGGQEHAFLWSAGVLSDLGTLGGTESHAFGINDAGTVVGSATLANGALHAFQWQNGVMRDLGGYADPTFEISASGISAGGMVAGRYRDPSTSKSGALRWVNGTPQAIGTLGGGQCWVYQINDLGHVVGASTNAQGFLHAFLFDGNTMVDLGTLPLFPYSSASDINNAGQVVGGAYTNLAQSRAVRWANGTATDLGTLGGADAAAYSINNQGDISGVASTAANETHPCLWPSTGGVIDLWQRTNPGPGWQSGYASDINDYGQIAAFGLLNGHWRALLLTPIRLVAFTLSASSVRGGQSATGTLRLNLPTPFNLTVVLADNLPAATVPASVVIPAGGTSATFNVATVPVSATQSGYVKVTYDGVSISRPFSVTP
jgi:probable HAF family extracellular repeat protein